LEPPIEDTVLHFGAIGKSAELGRWDVVVGIEQLLLGLVLNGPQGFGGWIYPYPHVLQFFKGVHIYILYLHGEHIQSLAKLIYRLMVHQVAQYELIAANGTGRVS